MPVLLVESGKSKGEALRLPSEGAVTVGREKSCDLRVSDVMASRRHFEVRAAAPGRFVIRDLGSSNGTTLNGAPLPPGEERALEIEDKIQLGSTIVSFVADGALERRGELTGRTLAGYCVEERIGRGGMGTVYKARQLSLDRTVALKILARELASDPVRVEQFLAEARAAGNLNHPNVVQVYDAGTEDGLTFFSMEYMARGSLERAIHEKGRLPLAEALRISIDVAKALEYAEHAGLVHRDVKPANIMLDEEGRAKLGDLGIATRAAMPGDAGEARSETAAGSPHYMAPEQARGLPVDGRADLYALGATIHHALAGEPPFQAASPREVIRKHLDEPPRPLSEIDPSIPEEVSRLVLRLLAKDAAERPASASAVLEELRALEARLVRGEAAPGGNEGPAPGARRTVAVAVLALVALVGIIGGFAGWKRVRDRREAKEAEDRAARERERVFAEESRRREAAEAERRREAERAAARERAALRALEEANALLAERPTELEAALARYRAIVDEYAGTASEAEARARIERIEPLLAELERTRRERERKEEEAARFLARIASEIERTPPEGLGSLRAEIEARRPALEGTAAGRDLAETDRAIMQKLASARDQAEREAAFALERQDAARARAAIDRVATWNVAEWRPWIDLWQTRIARSAEEAKKAATEADLARVRRADDLEKLRAFRHTEVRRAIEAVRAETPEGLALREARLFAIDCELWALEALRAHVNGKRKPAIEVPLGGSLDGVAVAADEEGLSFQAKNDARIEVRRPFASFGAGDLEAFFAKVQAEPRARLLFGLAALCEDLGDPARSKRLLEKAQRDAPEDLKAAIARALAGGFRK